MGNSVTPEVAHGMNCEINPLRGMILEDGDDSYAFRFPYSYLTACSFQLDPPFFKGHGDLAERVIELLRDPKVFKAKFLPLSRVQQDASAKGTRSIMGQIEGYQDRNISVSLGVVKGFPNGAFSIEPPHFEETLDKYMNAGCSQISAEGNVWTKNDKTIFGAYSLEGLEAKLVNTQRFSQTFNLDNNLEILAAGTHSSHNELGWMAYSLPSNTIRTSLLQAIDLIRRTNTKDPGIYGNYIRLLFERIMHMHEQGVGHFELHPGNCWPIIKNDGSIDLMVTDLSTAQDLNNLPNDAELASQGYERQEEAWLGSLNKKQKALAIELNIALSNVFLLSGREYETYYLEQYPFGIDEKSVSITEDMIDLQITYLVEAIAGNCSMSDEEIHNSNLRATVKKFLEDISIPKVRGRHSMIQHDWDSALEDYREENDINEGLEIKREELMKYMERPHYMISAAFRSLCFVIARTLAKGEKITFENFLANSV